ncbi:MAG: hypothetical protein AWM53_00830 [Candidatus Dichloromethanomonas elyunquensis]|nr:MAG: hypothetical protein AWM53_00830 [Candidatus Dichloromethanomonas elyunquensis]
MSILDLCVVMAPLIKETLGKKWNIVISDKEKYVLYIPGDVDFHLQVGEDIKHGTLMKEVLNSKKRTVRIVKKEDSKFGCAYIGMAIPLVNDHKIIGAFALNQTTESEDLLSMA